MSDKLFASPQERRTIEAREQSEKQQNSVAYISESDYSKLKTKIVRAGRVVEVYGDIVAPVMLFVLIIFTVIVIKRENLMNLFKLDISNYFIYLTILILGLSITYIILGRRIRKLVYKNSYDYLIISTVIAYALLLLSLLLKNGFGIIVIAVLLFYLHKGIGAMKRLIKIKEFNELLIK